MSHSVRRPAEWVKAVVFSSSQQTKAWALPSCTANSAIFRPRPLPTIIQTSAPGRKRLGKASTQPSAAA